MDTGVQEIENMEDRERYAIYNKIDILNSILWDNRVLKPWIEDWLGNFKEDERDDALYLLSKCMYFNNASIRAILRALYRDKYRTPIIQAIREANDGTLDENVIEAAYHDRLMNTRFLGVGNPSESGVHLLYYFRQENKIPKKLFVNTDDLYEVKSTGDVLLRKECASVEHIVFIDDLCGSGQQAKSDNNVKRCVEKLRNLENPPKVSYLMMFGTTNGINIVRNATLGNSEVKLFDEAEAVMELNESYKCFGELSRYFKDESEKNKSMDLCLKYGMELIDKIADRDWPEPLVGEKRIQYVRSCALGYGDCQLLLSLKHNTPNNTLPIFWFDEEDHDWIPILKRYNKVYY